MRLLPEPFETLRRDAGVGDATLAAAILGGFLVPGFLGVTETVAFWRMAGQPFPLWRAFALQLPQWVAYALLVPLILRLGQAVPVRRARWALPLMGHLAFALVLGSVYAAVAAAASSAFSPFTSERTYGQILVGWYLSGLPVMILAYLAVLGGGWAVYWFALHRSGEVASARLEAQLSDARLAALRQQLHPHFLFNSLNAVTVLVRDRDWEGAEHAVHLLAGLLRDALRTGGPDRVPLARELDFVSRYLELEKLRFPDRLRVVRDVPAELGDARVPVLVLQPLVENALRHGIAPSASAGVVTLRARGDGGRLVLAVEDDGRGPGTEGARGGAGVGLSNVRERLRVLYGDRASLTLEARPGGGAVATVSLPLESGTEGEPPRG